MCLLSGLVWSYFIHLCEIKLKLEPLDWAARAQQLQQLDEGWKHLQRLFRSAWTEAAAALLCAARPGSKKKKNHPRNDAQHSACITGRWDTIGSLCLDFNVSATVELEREYASRPDSNESDKTFLWGVALSPTKTTDFTCSFTKETVCQAWKEDKWWLSAVSVNDRRQTQLWHCPKSFYERYDDYVLGLHLYRVGYFLQASSPLLFWRELKKETYRKYIDLKKTTTFKFLKVHLCAIP